MYSAMTGERNPQRKTARYKTELQRDSQRARPFLLGRNMTPTYVAYNVGTCNAKTVKYCDVPGVSLLLFLETIGIQYDDMTRTFRLSKR